MSHAKKIMLSVWWCVLDFFHFDLLPNSSTIIADSCCQQLDRVAQKLRKAGSNLLHPRQCQTPCNKVDSWGIDAAELDYHSSVTILAGPSLPRLSIVSLSLALPAWVALRQRAKPQNCSHGSLRWEALGLLRAVEPFSFRSLAASHRCWWCIHRWELVSF